MFALRCTKPLLAKLGKLTPPGVGAEPEATTALGDWYAHRVNVGRHRLVLCTNALTRLSVVVPAKDLPALPARLVVSVALLLRRLGIPGSRIERELREMAWVRFGPTKDRSVIGTMNDFAWQLEFYLRDGSGSVQLSDVDWRLSECPCGPLKGDRPTERVRAVLLGGG